MLCSMTRSVDRLLQDTAHVLTLSMGDNASSDSMGDNALNDSMKDC